MIPAPHSNKAAALVAVTNPYDGSVVGHVERLDPTDVPRLMQQAQSGLRIAHGLSRAWRARILAGAAQIVAEHADEFAETIVLEAGKTIRQARKEVSRCVNTLKL